MAVTLGVNSDRVPAIDITVATPDGSNFTSVTVSRIADSGTTLTRMQPTPGLPSVTVTDFEAPWDDDIQYTATVHYGATTATWSAGPIRVSSTAAWLIHPTRPWLSVPIDEGNSAVAGIRSIGTVHRAASVNTHTVLRSRYPVVTSFGPRLAPTFPLTIHTVTQAEQDDLIALIDDQTPLLLRFPSSMPANLEAGFYSVGDVDEDRVQQYVGDESRVFTLALTRVASPAGTQQSTWDYPAITAAYADYTALRNAFQDYSALTAGQAN